MKKEIIEWIKFYKQMENRENKKVIKRVIAIEGDSLIIENGKAIIRIYPFSKLGVIK